MYVTTITSRTVYKSGIAQEIMMSKQRFVFLLKGEVVTPQSLEDPDAGEIIRASLCQSFSISLLHVLAKDNYEALAKFQLLSDGYPREEKEEVRLF